MRLPRRRIVDREHLIAQFCMDPTERHARALDTQQLHAVIVRYADRGQDGAAEMAEAELRRRESWAAPASRAFWISVFALLISLAALILGIAEYPWSATKDRGQVRQPPADGGGRLE